jgi:hypothetical protein
LGALKQIQPNKKLGKMAASMVMVVAVAMVEVVVVVVSPMVVVMVVDGGGCMCSWWWWRPAAAAAAVVWSGRRAARHQNSGDNRRKVRGVGVVVNGLTRQTLESGRPVGNMQQVLVQPATASTPTAVTSERVSDIMGDHGTARRYRHVLATLPGPHM